MIGRRSEKGFWGRRVWYLPAEQIGTSANPEDGPGRVDVEQRVEVDFPQDATLVSSEVLPKFTSAGGPTGAGTHMPVLDLDIPHHYVPSSTPGHAHLYLDVPLSHSQYDELLSVLAKYGIIEEGYYGAFTRRKATFARLPWVFKAPTDAEGGDESWSSASSL